MRGRAGCGGFGGEREASEARTAGGAGTHMPGSSRTAIAARAASSRDDALFATAAAAGLTASRGAMVGRDKIEKDFDSTVQI